MVVNLKCNPNKNSTYGPMLILKSVLKQVQTYHLTNIS